MNDRDIEKAADDQFWKAHRNGEIDHIRVGYQKGTDMQLLEIWHHAFRRGIEFHTQAASKEKP